MDEKARAVDAASQLAATADAILKGTENFRESVDKFTVAMKESREKQAKEVPVPQVTTISGMTKASRPSDLVTKSYTAPETGRRSQGIPLVIAGEATQYEQDVHEAVVRLKWKHEVAKARSAFGRPYLGIEAEFPEDVKNLGELVQKHWRDTANAGQEFLPIITGTQFIDFFTLVPGISAAFDGPNRVPTQGRQVVLPLDTAQSTVTVLGGGGTYPRGEATATLTSLLPTDGSPATSSVTITPVLHRGGVSMNEQTIDEAAGDLLMHARNVVYRDLALGMDSAILNGVATHNDANLDGTNTPNPASATFNGMRYFCHVTNATYEQDAGGTAFASDDVPLMRNPMGKYGVYPTDLVLLLAPSTYLQLVADADNKVNTVDKYGPAASVITGEVAKVWGISVIATDQMPENMNATGDVATTGTTTAAMLWNRRQGGWLGLMREIEIRVIPSPANYQIGVYGFSRFGWAPRASSRVGTYRYNLSLT